MPEPAYKRQLISTVYATPLMTPTPDLGLSIRLSMFELRETGDWDIFLGPPERARAETGGADQWVLKRRECSGFARVNKVTSTSLGYPLSVFNKNSTLKYSLPLAFSSARSFRIEQTMPKNLASALPDRSRHCLERFRV